MSPITASWACCLVPRRRSTAARRVGGIPQSGFIDLFTAHGYRSKRLTSELTAFNLLGKYLEDFTESPFETRDPWKIIPVVKAELAKEGKSFLFVFYYGTHWPYVHSPSCAPYQPEVPEDFDYTSGSLSSYRTPIENRYKNCLVEFDGWLQNLLGVIKLDDTIVVVIGDHGEELFESGRLGHCSMLNEVQTRTPCLIHIPQVAGRRWNFVTSHADLMPSIFDALGWKKPAGSYGQSIFRQGGPARGAVTATPMQFNPAQLESHHGRRQNFGRGRQGGKTAHY